MRALSATLLPLLAAAAVLSVPTGDQHVLDDLSRISKDWQHATQDTIRKGGEHIKQWVEDGKEFIKQHDITCEELSVLLLLLCV